MTRRTVEPATPEVDPVQAAYIAADEAAKVAAISADKAAIDLEAAKQARKRANAIEAAANAKIEESKR
jgi:hypothetical protein